MKGGEEEGKTKESQQFTSKINGVPHTRSLYTRLVELKTSLPPFCGWPWCSLPERHAHFRWTWLKWSCEKKEGYDPVCPWSSPWTLTKYRSILICGSCHSFWISLPTTLQVIKEVRRKQKEETPHVYPNAKMTLLNGVMKTWWRRTPRLVNEELSTTLLANRSHSLVPFKNEQQTLIPFLPTTLQRMLLQNPFSPSIPSFHSHIRVFHKFRKTRGAHGLRKRLATPTNLMAKRVTMKGLHKEWMNKGFYQQKTRGVCTGNSFHQALLFELRTRNDNNTSSNAS